jgi:hypothetical protein
VLPHKLLESRLGEDRNSLWISQTEINLPYITADQAGPKHLVMTLSRAKLEDLVRDLIEKTAGPVKAALKDAGLRPGEVDEVILVVQSLGHSRQDLNTSLHIVSGTFRIQGFV